jgi:hypothetical protein
MSMRDFSPQHIYNARSQLSASARETTGSAAIVDPSIYARLYDSSIRDPERFWG